MKKNIFILFIWLFTQIPQHTNAQEENYFHAEFNAHANLMFELGYKNWGYGGSVKLLFPLRRNYNYITTAANFDRFKVRDFKDYYYNLLSASIGYRKMINSFYVEPNIGLGYFLDEAIAVTFGVEPGFQINNLSFSLKAQIAVMGIFWAEYYSVLGIKVGYKIRSYR